MSTSFTDNTAAQSTSAPAPEGPTFVSRARDAAVLLETIVADRALLAQLTEDERNRLLAAAGQVSRPSAVERRQLVKATKRQRKAQRVEREESVLDNTGIRRLRKETVFVTPALVAPGDDYVETVDDSDVREPLVPQNCYICKRDYETIHHFYDQLCPECAAFNYAKRAETADLRGRVSLLTGGRVKIGYQSGIKLLRAGAKLIVTTRFPRDAAQRFAREVDFEDWSDRLEIFGLDLRHTPSVEAFCAELLRKEERLDFIVNNACQTVRRPPNFYAHMMEAEQTSVVSLAPHVRRLLGSYEGLRGYHMLPEASPEPASAPVSQLANAVGISQSAALSQLRLLPDEREAQSALFPEGLLDQDLQQVDLRDRNSWRMKLSITSSSTCSSI